MADRTDLSWCVHCGRVLAPLETDMDHVITAALGGGSSRVRVCKRCNSSLGSQLEGKLLGSASPFRLLARAHGFTLGTSQLEEPDSGAVTDVDYLTGEFRPRGHTFEETHHDDEGNPVRIRVTAAEGQEGHVVRRLNKRAGGDVWTYSPEQLPQVVRLGGFRVVIDVRDVRRLTVKVGLTAGAFLYGDAFASSPLAHWLRILLDVRRNWPGGEASTHPHAGAEAHDITSRENLFFNEVSAQVGVVGQMPLTGAAGTLLSPSPAVTLMRAHGGTEIGLQALGLDFPPMVIGQPLPSTDGYGSHVF